MRRSISVPARWPAMLAPLEVDGFGALWGANLLWYLARWMEQVVVGWLVLEMTSSPWLVALIGFWRNAPLLALGLVGGELADRLDRRGVLVGAQIVNLIVVAVVLGLIASGNITYLAIVIGQLLLGVSWAFDWPSRRALLMDLVGAERIVSAVLLDSSSMNVARIVGPLLGGVLLALFGVPVSYGVLLLFYAGSMVLASRLNAPAQRRAGGSTWRNLSDGVRYCWGNGVIMGVLLITIALNMFAFPYQQLLPVFARDILGVGPAGLGLLAAGDGIGALVAGFGLAALGPRLRRPGVAFTYGSIGMCVALLLFVVAPVYEVAVGALILFGLMHASFSAFQSSLILSGTRAELRGRAMGILTIAIGTSPLGALGLGLLASELGAGPAVAVGTGLALVGVVATAWRFPELRRGRLTT